MSLSFFYQCYKQPLACRHAIESIRKFYKDAPIFLFNDGGDPVHETIAKSFNNVYYEYCERESTAENGNYPDSTFSTKIYFGRILKALKLTTTDFMLLMEDDVIILKTIDTSSIISDLNGGHNMSHGDKINNYTKWWRNNVELLHSGFGGTIMRNEFFRNILTDPGLSAHLDEFFTRLRPGHAGNDLLLTFITYVYGGKVGRYNGLCEKNWPEYTKRITEGTIEVLHPCKEYYR
jgi:hypothetical protein